MSTARSIVPAGRFGAAILAGLFVGYLASSASGQDVIFDSFSGTSGSTLSGQAPDTTDLPGGKWQTSNSAATYLSPNQAALKASNGSIEIATSSGSYTAPKLITISAGLEDNNISGNSAVAVSRGLGLGFYATLIPNGAPSATSGFQGLTLDVGGQQTTAGNVELDTWNGTNGQNRLVQVPFPTAVLGTFSPTTVYTLSYSINTSTGQISNVSLSNGAVTDSADYAAIDNTSTGGVFTVASTAYAGVMNCSAASATGYVSNFKVQAALPAGTEWTGSGTVGSWADKNNWTGGVVPGLIAANAAAAISTDGVLFDIYNSANAAPVVDAGRNVKNITFDNSGSLTGSITLGTASGNALLLTSGGKIQTTFTVTLPQTVNAPLVLEGGGNYSLLSSASLSTATLDFGGAITPGATSGVTTLILSGANAGANTINGSIADGAGGTLALAVRGANWILNSADTYSGGTTITGGALTVANTTGSGTGSAAVAVSGGSLLLNGPISGALSIASGSATVGSGGSLGSSAIGVTGGKLILMPGGAIGNAAISVSGGGSFAVQPGSGALAIGATGAGAAGATLSIGAGGVFSMVDGGIGKLNLQQGSSFGASNAALTINGGTLKFEMGATGADTLAVNVGAASVSGTNTIALTGLGSSLTVGGNYTLISAPAGGLTGTFQFAGGSQSAYVSAGSNLYQVTLNNTPTAETASVAAAPPTIIQDTFAGTTGAAISGNAPNLFNLPGNNWQNAGVVDHGAPTYNGSNQGKFAGNNGGTYIALSSATYTPPTVLTVSAALAGGGQGTDETQNFRGMGVGFQSYVPSSTQNSCNSGFQCMAINTDGTVVLYLATAPTSNAGGQFEVAYPSSAINYASVFGAPYATSNFYTISYTIDTVSGVISNISMSNGTVTDTADFTNLDGMVTTMTGAATAYAGIVNSGFGTVGYAENFTISGGAASGPSSNWTGTAGDSTWATAGNWSAAVPGSTTGTTNADTALFNATVTSSPTVIDVGGRNVMNITFDTAAVSSMTIGTTTGPALILTSGGTIQTTSTVTNPQVVNAPLVLEGNYTFTSGSTTAAATLTFGGGIKPDASLTTATTTLTLNGSNTGANTISGVLSDNGSAKLALSVSGTGVWVLNGATSTYSGGTTIASGATLQLAGSVAVMSQSMNVANAGSLVVASSTNQKIGAITGSGALSVNSGSLTAYQILQKSLTIAAGATVTLSPSGSGSISDPQGPNNTNYSSNVGSLSIAGATNAWTGTLDIGNNGLVIQYGSGTDPFKTIENMVLSGYNSGSWGGTGITSVLAQHSGSTNFPLNIGLEDFTPNANGFGASIVFSGQTIATSAVLVRLTYMDDLELAGDMSQENATNDALLFAANYSVGTTWGVGDVTHDGSINANDALLFAANYGIGFPSLDGTTGNAAVGAFGLASVPEPSAWLLAAIGAVGLRGLSRRRWPVAS